MSNLKTSNDQGAPVALPKRYTFKPHASYYQQLIIWPACTMQVAWYNERVCDLVEKLPGLGYQSIAAKSGLDKFLQMSPHDRVTWAAVTCREVSQDSSIHPFRSICFADAGDGGQIYGSYEALAGVGAEGIRAFGTDQIVANERDELVRAISQSIARLRQIADEPVAVPLWGVLDMEVRPDDDDDRVLIGRKDWGFTTVNYTHEGLIVDVVAEGDTGCVHTVSVHSSDLAMPEPDEQDASQDMTCTGGRS
ncbi:MAG: hypothetical protein K2W33_14990 [Burkholderiales bacterium]|nr:hypothetical protein [Burkholderiales bacterium]